MERKTKIGAPSKGGDKKQQVTVSVPQKIVDTLTIETIRKVATNIINIAYENALKKEKNV